LIVREESIGDKAMNKTTKEISILELAKGHKEIRENLVINCPYCNKENKLTQYDIINDGLHCYRCKDKIILSKIQLENKELI
jgi:transposase-like protein